jgi:acyl-CoA synthetase (AMP-forming)/AMP-acid ligase II
MSLAGKLIEVLVNPPRVSDPQRLRRSVEGATVLVTGASFKVSRFEQPRDITIVKVIPRNPAGKVLRNELEPE